MRSNKKTMGKMLKMIFLTLSMAFVFGLKTLNIEASELAQSSIIKSVKVDKKDVKLGDIVNVEVELNPDLLHSNSYCEIGVMFANENYTDMLERSYRDTLYLDKTESNNVYKGSLEITDDMISGEWYINNILLEIGKIEEGGIIYRGDDYMFSAYDEYNKNIFSAEYELYYRDTDIPYNFIKYDFSNQKINVSGTSAVLPKIESLTMEKDSQDEDTVIFKATLNEGGEESAICIELDYLLSNGEIESIALFNENGSIYEGELQIDKNESYKLINAEIRTGIVHAPIDAVSGMVFFTKVGVKDIKLSDYNINVNEVIQSGWVLLDNKWYYYNEDGSVRVGWLNDNGTWYYLRSNGEMATGWELVGNQWYYLNEGGAMTTGWLNNGGTWYYLDESGAMVTGWLNNGGIWYYLNQNGSMATNTVVDGWKIDASGVATPL